MWCDRNQTTLPPPSSSPAQCTVAPCPVPFRRPLLTSVGQVAPSRNGGFVSCMRSLVQAESMSCLPWLPLLALRVWLLLWRGSRSVKPIRALLLLAPFSCTPLLLSSVPRDVLDASLLSLVRSAVHLPSFAVSRPHSIRVTGQPRRSRGPKSRARWLARWDRERSRMR